MNETQILYASAKEASIKNAVLLYDVGKKYFSDHQELQSRDRGRLQRQHEGNLWGYGIVCILILLVTCQFTKLTWQKMNFCCVETIIIFFSAKGKRNSWGD